MAESCIETPEAPAWLSKLESQREKLSKARLGHDSGAGAPCNSCGPKCPGLDLHFWRKVCRSCHCSKDTHDVQDDELSGWAQFTLLGTKRPNNEMLPLIKIQGVTDKPVKLDWVPPNASTELVSEYMSALGSELAPVSGSPAAKRWRQQLRKQLPHHDVIPTEDNVDEHKEYISRIKDHVVGMGNVIRVGNKQSANLYSFESSKSHTNPTKSYALPIKVSNLSKGIKYNVVPKNITDKKLILDSRGDIVSSAANLPDYKVSPAISRIVKDKLFTMKIESDRIKSAIENGPIYDNLFRKLGDLNSNIENDIYLKPIKQFREEFNKNPQFREETSCFGKQFLGAIPLMERSQMNNNEPLKGTIFAPDGEIWSWKKDSLPMINPELETPPKVNYKTYPGAQEPVEVKAFPPANVHHPIPQYPKCSDKLIERVSSLNMNDEEPTAVCRYCNLPMYAGQVAVAAERAGSAVWHPQCFKCHRCGQLLADLVYFWHDGEVYCARDLADVMQIPRCAGCDELIFSRPYTVAEGRSFHVNHFCCYKCDLPLGGNKYIPDEQTDLQICLDCYNKYYAHICRSCNRRIEPEERGLSWSDIHWHVDCFNCAGVGCGRSLLKTKFVVKQEKPFCSTVCVRSVLDI